LPEAEIFKFKVTLKTRWAGPLKNVAYQDKEGGVGLLGRVCHFSIYNYYPNAKLLFKLKIEKWL